MFTNEGGSIYFSFVDFMLTFWPLSILCKCIIELVIRWLYKGHWILYCHQRIETLYHQVRDRWKKRLLEGQKYLLSCNHSRMSFAYNYEDADFQQDN
jgi:hypothetical protein